MKPLALVGALIGGLAGFGLWVAIGHFAGYSVGYVAIGVGLFVGIGSRLLGGISTVDAAISAAVAFAAIIAGTIVTNVLAISDYVEETLSEFGGTDFWQQEYERDQRIAVAFAKVNPQPDGYREFMDGWNIDYDDDSSVITDEEVATFTNTEVPILQKMGADGKAIDLEQYMALHDVDLDEVKADMRDAIMEDVSISDHFELIDLLFWALGIGAAFATVRGKTEENAAQAPPRLPTPGQSAQPGQPRPVPQQPGQVQGAPQQAGQPGSDGVFEIPPQQPSQPQRAPQQQPAKPNAPRLPQKRPPRTQ